MLHVIISFNPASVQSTPQWCRYPSADNTPLAMKVWNVGGVLVDAVHLRHEAFKHLSNVQCCATAACAASNVLSMAAAMQQCCCTSMYTYICTLMYLYMCPACMYAGRGVCVQAGSQAGTPRHVVEGESTVTAAIDGAVHLPSIRCPHSLMPAQYCPNQAAPVHYTQSAPHPACLPWTSVCVLCR